MGRKCSVESCLSDSNRAEDTGVTFHKVPLHPDIRPKWLDLCRIPEDKKSIKIIYVCSRHFLNADFCNFKGRKYMLRQGVLPSVFPWNKLKKAALKSDEETDVAEVKQESNETKEEPSTTTESQPAAITDENKAPVTQAEPATMEQEIKKDGPTSQGTIKFTINEQIEALDFNQVWSAARIVEIDYEENEVLIHFEDDKCSSKPDEWICMDSARLRPPQPDAPVAVDEKFVLGERCMASWSDARKFPATVQRIVDEDTYEVLFDDGFIKVLKGHRLVKANAVNMQSAPLFLPVRGTKQDRRDKKRKLNVAALFGNSKKVKMNSPVDKKNASPQHRKATAAAATVTTPADDTQDDDQWLPRWVNGRPVGEDSFIESNDGLRKSVIVADPRLPEGWKKHLAQRVHGLSAGKWDTIIVSPEGRKFRTRGEVRTYLENRHDVPYSDEVFNFALSAKRGKKRSADGHRKSHAQPPPPPPPAVEPSEALEISTAENSAEEEDNANSLKIPVVNDAFKCPIEGCGKSFRKENLAQMHVKHYHPEYTKFLDFTPNVADLAYARTVGEALDKSPSGPSKPTPAKPPPKQAPVKYGGVSKPQSPNSDIPPGSPSSSSKTKDAEIIKLLNSKPFDSCKQDEAAKQTTLPSGLPPNMYPDIKLRDLLSRSEGIPKRDDLNLKTLSASTHRPTGIKTLLPVVRMKENRPEGGVPMDIDYTPKSHKIHSQKHGPKRKRYPTEPTDSRQESPSVSYHENQFYPQQQQGNVIIEGGEVIKIVRMKREEIINCTCGITEEDGLMIQCELCLCWQHAYCNNIERENQVPEKYICYICQNPVRQRSSRKYFHDQDWLKLGTLPTGSYHSKDEEVLNRRFEKLRKSHDISGGLLELKDYVHTLKVKIKIAGTKNHPKLYQWIKPWDKPPLPEKVEPAPKEEPKTENDCKNQKNEIETKQNLQGGSMLLSILNEAKEEQKIKDEFSGFPLEQQEPNIPQPEAAMDPAECRLNLLDHIAHSQSLVEERLDDFEEQINALEDDSVQSESDEDYPRLRQTLQMLMRDLNRLKEFSQIPTI